MSVFFPHHTQLYALKAASVDLQQSLQEMVHTYILRSVEYNFVHDAVEPLNMGQYGGNGYVTV